LGNSCISIFSNELEAYNTAKIDFSEIKCSNLFIFEEKFQIGHHLVFLGPFSQKIEQKSQFTKTA
jgi:hypothetical protein